MRSSWLGPEARDPGFGLGTEHARLVAEIAKRLDGLPLAIELVAAAALTPDEIERAWSDGSQMGLEEAIDLGRQLLAASS